MKEGKKGDLQVAKRIPDTEVISQSPLIKNYRDVVNSLMQIRAGELPEAKRQFLEAFSESEIELLKGFLDRLNK